MKDNTLQEIKDRLNIADVISGYIQMKKAGINYKAVCPFHHEKTPSMMISPQKQIWHCFGCGEGGDVFGFVMRYENLEFKDALKILADKAGVRLPEYRPKDPKVEDEKDLLLRINDFAARFYHQLLVRDQRGTEALEYLKKRGLTSETIERWQIGYAPEDFHILERALDAKKVKKEDLVRAGLSIKNERGQVYDRFRGRVTFPIFNYLGEVVGFSARILKDDGKSAKYVNSPETAVYNKSQVLFGVNFAKNTIRRNDEAVIVEGQMDCISAHQAGFSNVVASSGTALTAQQLNILGRLTKNLKFCFDGDAAGLQATRRAIELYLGQDFTIKIVTLPDAKDPDELIKKDPSAFERQVKDAKLFLDYYIEKAFENFASSSIEQKKTVSKDLLPLVSYLTDPMEKDHYVNQLAARFGTTEKVLRDTLQKFGRPLQSSTTGMAQKQAPIQPSAHSNSLEKEVLGGMLVFPAFFEKVVSEGQVEDFEHQEIREIAAPFFAGKKPRLADRDGQLPTVAKEGVFMVESQVDDLSGSEAAVIRQLEKSFALLRISGIKRRQLQLNAEIKSAESSKDRNKLQKLNKEFANISSLRLQYEKLV